MNQEEKYNTAKWDAGSVRKESAAYPDRSSVRRRRKKKLGLRFWLIWCVFVLVSSAILAGVGWLLANDMCAFNKEPLTATIEVTKEDNMRTIANKLKDAGLIEYKWFFKLFAGIRNAEDKIGVGSYELTTDLDYNALISGMRNSNAALSADTVRVSFPEGYSVRQVIERLVEYGVSTEEELLDAVQEGDYSAYEFLDADKSGIAKLEGYLFPDTYEFYVGEDAKHAICRFLDNYNVKMTAELLEKVEASKYDLNQIMTIASLIEKETDGSDHTKIASVIYNRLHNVGETYYKLEIDASIIYGLGYAQGKSFTGPLTKTHLETDTPYNLAIHEGLPPTPIGNPGLASIKAALDPAETNYYFYALGKDGVHHFSKTYNEHVNFVNSSQYVGN